jgi:antitoxin component YwqK of YwqJK toxin-antitoxin module
MRYFHLFLLLIVIQPSFAQISRAFITMDGKFSNDPHNAVNYILIQKLDEDSAYMVRQFDMRDTIVMQGIYKDKTLETPNGKFVYYKKIHLSAFHQKSINIKEYIPIDTNNYVADVRYYINGKKTGTWITYWARNKVLTENTYENDKLNGPFIVYDELSGVWTQGTMRNDTTVGSTFMYNPDSLLIAETKFKDGKPTGSTIVLEVAQPKYDLYKYMEVKLSKYKEVLSTAVPAVAFTVDKSGKLKDAKIAIGNSPEIDQAIIAAILDAPPFEPAIYKGAIVEDKLCLTFGLFRRL